MAGDAFQKFKSTFNRGVTTINVKTASSLEKVKIKTHIDSINKEMEHLFLEIGRAAYEIWEKGSVDFSILEEQCLSVKQKEEEIIQLNEEYNSIDERDGKILGTSMAEETKNEKEDVPVGKESITCPKCKAIYYQSVRFCTKCGQQLKN